jgi:nitrite reductase/ring-hydroxylating ferredoxin subunit
MLGIESGVSFLFLALAVFLAFFAESLPTFLPWLLLILILFVFAIYFSYYETLKDWIEENFILQKSCDSKKLPYRLEHDKRRNLTYPPAIPNTWYHLCDADELPIGKVLEIRALNKVFVAWRGKDGIPVVQDAYCLHQGANLGVLGKVSEDGNCIQCPFHQWKYNKDGSVNEIPYNKEPKNVPKNVKLRTYHCQEYCGWICVYFHADSQKEKEEKEPEFPLPSFVSDDIKEKGFQQHMKWNSGFHPINVIDLVDQVADHSHFNIVHGQFLIPWTLFPLPAWLYKLFPVGINHELKTFIGDDKEWKEIVQTTGFGSIDKHLVYFYDRAGITWNNQVMEKTLSQTIEMYVGPSLVIFNIPLDDLG